MEGATMAYSIEDVLSKCNPEAENFIIGGGSVYAQFLPLASRLYITRVHKDFDADTFFPEINLSEWSLLNQEFVDAEKEGDLPHTYQVYVRR